MTEWQGRKPDFFIVGAPKCGTTSLWRALLRHPQVFMPPEVKEPHFFGTDLNARHFVRDSTTYLQLFEGANGARRAGEASPWYMYSRLAAAEIHDFSPQARIIALLRNPVDMMYSLHSQRLYNGGENIKDFAEALQAEEARRTGEQFPDTPIGPKEGLLYRDVARYAEQLERFINAFGRDLVHIVVFEDMKRNSTAAYREILRFLEVDDAVSAGLPKANVNKRVRSTTMRTWLRSVPESLAFKIGRDFIPKDVRTSVRYWLERLNTRVEPRPPMDSKLRARLVAEMEPEVQKVGQILGRDLTVEWGK